HTATRLAMLLIEPVRRLNPRAHLCFYGLYAPVNEAHLRELGVQTIVGGEFEAALADVMTSLAHERSSTNGTGTTAADGNASRTTSRAAARPRSPAILRD